MWEKKALRRHIRELKNRYSYSELESLSSGIISLLESDPLFVRAKCVLLYNSLPDEVFTHALIEKYVGLKTILLPTVVGEDLQLHVYDKDASFNVGAYGIGESDGGLFTDYEAVDLAVVPGMAFDVAGHRLGRGKGYYDRMLPNIHCPKYGLCFGFQLVDEIECEGHDILMDKVFTL